MAEKSVHTEQNVSTEKYVTISGRSKPNFSENLKTTRIYIYKHIINVIMFILYTKGEYGQCNDLSLCHDCFREH